MPVQVWFPRDTFTVTPGEQIVLRATVQNPGADTEAYTVVPWGLNGSWLHVDQPSVTLFGGTSKDVDVTLCPPRLWSTTAGRYEVEIRVVPQGEPLAAMSAVAVVDVDGFEDVEVAIAPPERNVRRRARYEIDIANRGNSLANCHIRFVPQSDDLRGVLDPSLLAVSPGSHGTAQLTVVARDSRFRRDERFVGFEVEVAVSGRGEQTTLITSTAGARLLETFAPRQVGRRASLSMLLRLVVLVLVAVGAWWLVVAPWIQRRVDHAVEDRIATRLAPTSGADESVGSVPPAIALSPSVSTGRTGEESYRGPNGSGLWIDELILQNPSRDAGTAVLTVGADVVRRWDLSSRTNTAAITPKPPIAVGADETVGFSVSCVRPGGKSQLCEAALVIIVRQRTP